MTPDTEPASPVPLPRKKPHLSFLLATWFGLGYLPKAPGTWGSLAGVVLTVLVGLGVLGATLSTDFRIHDRYVMAFLAIPIVFCLVIAIVGVLTSARVSDYSGKKDPQFVVIDEVSGQMLTLLIGLWAPAGGGRSLVTVPTPWHVFAPLLAGFILFRLFDIWKPFPIRKLEKLPGGWGIMADDWLAGIYAAILLRLALHFNPL
jgi:phosphatidylglycerophosphatase A